MSIRTCLTLAAALACAVLPDVTHADPLASGQVNVGNARFTVVTPNCVRLEYDAGGRFVDDPSYFATRRDARWSGATVTTAGNATTLDTGVVRLTYAPNGKPFDADNLKATIHAGARQADWHPGQPSTGNLGGTERTLDGWNGPRKLSDGLLSRDGWYLLDDSKSVLLTPDWAKPRPADAGTDWYLFGYGDDYRAALRSLTAVSGPVPLPRRYMMGVWYSRYWPYTSADYRTIVQEYADHDYPLDGLVMDMDWHTQDAKVGLGHDGKLGWTGYTWNAKLLPDHQALLDWLHARGLAVTLNDHPHDGVRPHESAWTEFMRAMGKDPATDAPLPFDAGDKNYLDHFYRYTHQKLEDQGVDFWWLDWQQFPYTRSIAGLTNLQWLNHYYYHATGRDGRRGVSFSRWGGWGSQRYPIQFSGDAGTSFRMLAAEVPFTATAGNVGCFYWSHDIGGHNGGRNEESYARWCQFGAFSAMMRSHPTRDATMDRRPWTYAPWAEASMRVSYRMRSQFFPAVYSAAARATADSVPFIRPMYLDHPGDEAAYHQPQQYAFGDDILVAPIAEAGVGPNRLGRQTVWFPPGSAWFNYFTNERFDGGQQALVAATIDEFPLYLRAGVPIPMRPFTQRMATDPLGDLVLRCYPGIDGQTGSADLYEDDGLSTAYATGAAAHTKLTYSRAGKQVTVVVAPTVGTFKGQAEQRAITVELPATLAATGATVDGAAVKPEFVQADNLNVIRIPARSIRAGCTVIVNADEAAPDLSRRRAFARRSGTDGTLPVAGQLAAALAKTPDESLRGALAAAAGVGVFAHNETAYGYPETTVPRTFETDAVRIATTEQTDAWAAATTAPFTVTIAGQRYRASCPPTPVDWSKRPGNVAGSAHVTVSSGNVAKGLVDGRVGGFPNVRGNEWASNHEKAGAWAKLAWDGPQVIDHIVLFDRPNLNDHVLAGKVEFSDGSTVPFGPLDNAADTGTAVAFPRKSVDWLKVTLTALSPETSNAGLSEVVVLAPR